MQERRHGTDECGGVGRVAAAAVALTLSTLLASACEPPAPPLLTWVPDEADVPTGVDSESPHLATSGDALLMSWLERAPDGTRTFLFAALDDSGWSTPRVVTADVPFMVHGSDVPSVVEGGDGALYAHWLERPPGGGAGYGVRLSRSTDRGATWSNAWTPHDDASDTEHGFVSLVPWEDGIAALWLDGRGYASAEGGAGETGLLFRTWTGGAGHGSEVVVDARTCDCCPTAVAVTASGPLVAYRDRTDDEIRDVRVRQWTERGWTDGRIVHDDGWETGACPVNGPALAARGDSVVVAWFTAAHGEPRVRVAFSDDAGRSFGAPSEVDAGAPAGRVDVLLLGDGTAVVAWVERTGGAETEVLLRRVDARGWTGDLHSATGAFSERVTGVPRLGARPDGSLVVAWTDGAEITPRVRVTEVWMESP